MALKYLAPERIRGAAASPPADVYALGACAFEALAGRPPFRAETPLRTAIAHVEEPVPSLPDGVPAFLRDLAAKARPYGERDLTEGEDEFLEARSETDPPLVIAAPE